MGMDLYVYQPVNKKDKSHGVERTFCLTQERIDYLVNNKVDIQVEHRLWHLSPNCTDFDIDCLFGRNIEAANKLIIGPGSRYYCILQDTIGGVPHFELKSYRISSFYDPDCVPLNSYHNLVFDFEDGARTEAVVKVPDHFVFYDDDYLCKILVRETGYYRKPFRHESTLPKVNENGCITISIDNFTNDLGKKAYEILATVTPHSDIDFVSSPEDLVVLKQLAECSNDPTFWKNKILSNSNPFLVNINW